MSGVAPYPWHTLPRIARPLLDDLRAARQCLGPVSLRDLAQALGELAGAHIDLMVTGTSGPSPVAPDAVVLESAREGIRWAVRPDNALAQALVSRVLQQGPSIPRVEPAELAPPLRGAVAAIVLEALRRIETALPLRLGESPGHGDWTHWTVTCRIDGRPYSSHAWMSIQHAVVSPPVRVTRPLPALPVTLAVVAAVSTGRIVELASLEPGDGWFPEPDDWWARPDSGSLRGRLALCEPRAERGVWVNCSEGGRVVLTAEEVVIAPPFADEGVETETREMNESEDPLTRRVLDAPVMVRVEVASVTLTARQWADLAPGDVIETQQPVGTSVTLRAAGREIARGELVNVDGQLGVRIQELVREGPE